MRILNRALLVSAFGGVTALVAACPASLEDRCANGTCDPSASSSSGEGGVDTGTDGPPVDPCIAKPSDPQCLDENVSFFVSPTGADTNSGTRAAPLKTIGGAIGKVSAAKKRIYVCEGTYAENVEVRTSLSILGGLACSWDRAGQKPRIVPPKGPALAITKVTGASIGDLALEGAADSNTPGASAIACLVSESTAIVLKGVEAKAGAGVKGKPGANGIDAPNYTAAIATAGVTTSNATGGAAPACETCVDASFSTGGKGADDGAVPLQGSAQPPIGVNNAGASGGTCTPGGDGANGPAGSAAKGAEKPGQLAASGWTSTAGENGVAGRPGQGGGGGGSETGAGGGSGGCGGCGGTGGKAAGSGGSSFAALVFSSEVTFEDSTLTSSSGADGGGGGKGQDGQRRGGTGGGVCAGGFGGQGAGGGGGGGGSGGHSIAVGYVGKEPATPRSTLTVGASGGGGDGGTPGAAFGTGNPGLAGLSGKPGIAAKLQSL